MCRQDVPGARTAFKVDHAARAGPPRANIVRRDAQTFGAAVRIVLWDGVTALLGSLPAAQGTANREAFVTIVEHSTEITGTLRSNTEVEEEGSDRAHHHSLSARARPLWR